MSGTQNQNEPQEETIVTTAEYRGFLIYATSLNRILVKVYTETYPVSDLNEAKTLIDKTINEKVN